MSSNTGKIVIDGNEYNLNDLSEGAKQQLMNLRATDQELTRLRQQAAIANTARASYANALTAELAKMGANKH